MKEQTNKNNWRFKLGPRMCLVTGLQQAAIREGFKEVGALGMKGCGQMSSASRGEVSCSKMTEVGGVPGRGG